MSKFDERLQDLIDHANDMATGIRQGLSGLWSEFGVTDFDDHDNISAEFSRDDLAQKYKESVNQRQSIRRMQSSKLENDYLAALERDFRARHRSRVRMMAHAAAKSTTQGQPAGPTGRVDMYISRLEEQE